MPDNFSTPVPAGTTFAGKQIGNVIYEQAIFVDETGADAISQLLAALAGTLITALPTGAATDAKSEAIRALLAATSGFTASGITPAVSALTATGQSAALTPIAGRPFNVTISGTFSATAQIERSFNGTTWFAVLTDALRQTLPPSFSLTETEVGVQYRVNVTAFTSGTVNIRLSA